MNTKIPGDIDLAKEKKIVSDLYGYCWSITPSNLFRYRSCTEYHISAFENDQILLSKPTTFNDPHDSFLFIDRESIINGITNQKPETNIKVISRLLNDTNFRKQQESMLGQKFVKRILQNATMNGKPIPLDMDFLKKREEEHISRIDQIIHLSKKSIRQAALVACFSETITSSLMWSHYSSSHKGFALNYDLKSMYSVDIGLGKTRGSLFVDNKLFPVIYSAKRYDATYYAEFHFIDDFYRKLGLEMPRAFYDKLFYYKALLFKSLDWAYEKEWRMIRLTDNNIENYKPDYSLLCEIRPKELFLGAEISEKNKEILLKIASKKNIPAYQMFLDDYEHEYKLKFNRVY